MDQRSAPVNAKAKKKGGCLKSCLIFLLVIMLLVGIAAALIFRIPRRLGWVKGPGERLTEQTHERLTAEEIVDEAETKGFKSEGVEVYVFPKPDSGDAVLLATFDFSKSVQLSGYGAYHPVVGTLVLLGGGEKAKEHSITHVGAEFLDEEGNRLLVVASSTADIRELNEGKITEEEFRARWAIDVNYPNYIQRAVIPF